MFKMVSESFIHSLLLFLGLFLKSLVGGPCVLGSFSVVLMSCKINFHIVRSSLQYFFFLAELNRSIQIVVNYNNFLNV